MKTVFSYSENFINLHHKYPLNPKFGAFSSKFKGDMCDSLKHLFMLCYYPYVSV